MYGDTPAETDLNAAYEIMKGNRPVFSEAFGAMPSDLEAPAPVPSAFRSGPSLLVTAPGAAGDTQPPHRTAPAPRSPSSVLVSSTSSPSLTSTPSPVLLDGELSTVTAGGQPFVSDGSLAGVGKREKSTVYGVMIGDNGRRLTLQKIGNEFILLDPEGQRRVVLHREGEGNRFVYQLVRPGEPVDMQAHGVMLFEQEGLETGQFTRFDTSGKAIETYSFSGTLKD